MLHIILKLQKITNYRNELTEDKQEAIAVAETWGVWGEIWRWKNLKAERRFDELIDDHRIKIQKIFRNEFQTGE